jgi:hypothetical protein
MASPLFILASNRRQLSRNRQRPCKVKEFFASERYLKIFFRKEILALQNGQGKEISRQGQEKIASKKYPEGCDKAIGTAT